MARKYWMFPYRAFTDAPTMQTCSGAVYRATLAMALAYWRADCKLSAVDDVTATAITRLPMSGWRPIKVEVLNAINTDIGPALTVAFNDKAKDLPRQRERARIMTAARARKRAERLLAQQSAAPSTVPYALPTRLNSPPSEPASHSKTTPLQSSDHPTPTNTNTDPSIQTTKPLARSGHPPDVSRETRQHVFSD